MRWRIGLIDSCGALPRAVASAGFRAADGQACRAADGPDPTGHGTRIATILTRDGADVELVLAQVFGTAGPTSAAAVAAAIDWCLGEGVELLQLSLGLAADRPVLAEAVARAVDRGCVLVAATPSRGGPVYPAAYPGVIRGTGDARCAPGQVSELAAATFGGCPRSGAPGRSASGQGASVGAAEVTRVLIEVAESRTMAGALAALTARASYRGPERRTHAAAPPKASLPPGPVTSARS